MIPMARIRMSEAFSLRSSFDLIAMRTEYHFCPNKTGKEGHDKGDPRSNARVQPAQHGRVTNTQPKYIGSWMGSAAFMRLGQIRSIESLSTVRCRTRAPSYRDGIPARLPVGTRLPPNRRIAYFRPIPQVWQNSSRIRFSCSRLESL